MDSCNSPPPPSGAIRPPERGSASQCVRLRRKAWEPGRSNRSAGERQVELLIDKSWGTTYGSAPAGRCMEDAEAPA